jgi:hypothetical protein
MGYAGSLDNRDGILPYCRGLAVMEMMMKPTKGQIFALARMFCSVMSAEAADALHEAIEEADGDPMRAAALLMRGYPVDAPFVTSLERRIVTLLAFKVLLSFAPGVKAELEREESDMDN